MIALLSFTVLHSRVHCRLLIKMRVVVISEFQLSGGDTDATSINLNTTNFQYSADYECFFKYMYLVTALDVLQDIEEYDLFDEPMTISTTVICMEFKFNNSNAYAYINTTGQVKCQFDLVDGCLEQQVEAMGRHVTNIIYYCLAGQHDFGCRGFRIVRYDAVEDVGFALNLDNLAEQLGSCHRVKDGPKHYLVHRRQDHFHVEFTLYERGVIFVLGGVSVVDLETAVEKIYPSLLSNKAQIDANTIGVTKMIPVTHH